MKSQFILPQGSQRIFTKFTNGCKTEYLLFTLCVKLCVLCGKNTFRSGLKYDENENMDGIIKFIAISLKVVINGLEK